MKFGISSPLLLSDLVSTSSVYDVTSWKFERMETLWLAFFRRLLKVAGETLFGIKVNIAMTLALIVLF